MVSTWLGYGTIVYHDDICSGEGIEHCTETHIEGTPDKYWGGHCEAFWGERRLLRPEGKEARRHRKVKNAVSSASLAGINRSSA